MNRLSILGAGGHGRVVADAAESCRYWDEIVFYDDKWPDHREQGPWKLLGTVQSFLKTAPGNGDVIVAIGDNAVRSRIATVLRDAGFTLATIIHPMASVSRYARIGPGTVVFAGAVVNIGALVGPACIVNTGAIVEHDCILGAGVHVSIGANLAGGVMIGDESCVGAGASIRQQMIVGSQVTVGAGAVVVTPISDCVTVVGNPARLLLKRKIAR